MASNDQDWDARAKIFSAKGRFVVERETERLMLQLLYFDGVPAVMVQVKFLSPELERHSRHHACLPRDLPLMLRHAARVLEEAIKHTESDKRHSAGEG